MEAPGGSKGNLAVGFSLERLEQQSSENRLLGVLLSLGILGLGLPVSWVLGTLSAAPVRLLTDRALAVAEGRASLDVLMKDTEAGSPSSPDEARRLLHAVQVMAQRIAMQVAQTEAERQRARDAEEKAVEASTAKSAFLANMSHELRTPLNAIIGYGEILAEEAEESGDDAALADVTRILTAGRHLLSLINDVLDLSKIEAGYMEFVPEPTDLDALVDDVVGASAPLASRNGNQFVVERDPSLGWRSVDATKVRQCLLNLLGNAHKFTENGTVTLSVGTTTRGGDAGWLQLEVRDSGIGMTPEQLGRIFRPFTQAEVTTSRRYGGTGLGLTLTRRLCELMGGSISVESEVGAGSTFRVLVPARVAEQPSAGEARIS